MDNLPAPPPNRALRMTFRYDGDKLELVSSQRVEMILPQSHPLDAPESPATFSFAVRDAAGRRLYRRLINPPIQTDAEVFHPDGSIRRVPIDRPSGTFVLLVPDVPEGDSLVLVGPRPGADTPVPTELATFSLRRPPDTRRS